MPVKAWLLSFFQTPPFEDDDDRRAAQLLRLVLVVCLLCIVGYGLATIDNSLPWSRRLPWLGALVVALACEHGLQRGYVRPQAWVIVVGLVGLSLVSIATSGGLRSPAALTLFVTVVLAGQLLGWGGALIVAVIGCLGALAVFELYHEHWMQRGLLHTEGQYARSLVVQLMGTGALIAISAWSLSMTLRRLRREQAAYRDLVEEAPDAMASLDANGRVASVNRAMENLVGRPRDKILGEAFDTDHGAITAEARVEAQKRHADLMAGKPQQLFRFELLRPDGSRVFCESNAREVRRSDGSRGVDLVVRDITEQVLAEKREQELQDQLRAARKLEAIGQLAGGVAHDFNNLLTVVLGNVQMLRMSRLESDQGERVASIEAAAERAATITKQLLAIGRRQPSRPTALSLNDSVQQLSELLRRLVPEHVLIDTRLAADLPGVLADPAQIDQVLLNLVANARDAMPDGGKLSIETGIASVSDKSSSVEVPAGSYVTLRVRDSGHGMSQETRERVFEPFFTTKGHAAGTGLGLATVYGIVQQHHGHITVESTPGSGSTFTVYLPAGADPTSVHERVARPVSRRPVRILLVDDDEPVRRVVAMILRRAGHEVSLGGSADEALLAANQLGQRLELLITDVVMPGKSGIELWRELQQRVPALKVLFLSGYPGEHAQTLADGPGIDYLAKPITPEHLLARVDQLLAAT